MRIFLTICIFLLQFFVSNNTDAKPLVKNITTLATQKIKQHHVSQTALRTDLTAENAHVQIGFTSVKSRVQRLQLYTLLGYASQLLMAPLVRTVVVSYKYTPASIPIGRLLLFPQHHFL